MGLNVSKGNMYEWIDYTWNTVKGECPHGCSYCYVKRWGKQPKLHFDESELKTDLGSDNFIFVGSSCDLFAEDIPFEWIYNTIEYCNKFDNNYLFQTKNPSRIIDRTLPPNSVVCTTIETNRWYKDVMNNCPAPYQRAAGMYCIDLPKYLTIEPILDFDLKEMIEIVISMKVIQVNIGANTSLHVSLPEPPKEKILELITELKKHTVVKEKSNLKRLLK